MKRSVEVHVPGKPPLCGTLEAPVSLVNSGGLALVEKGSASGGPVLLELSPRDEGVLVETNAGVSVTVRYEGREITSQLVPWGDEVFVQGARITFVLDASSADRVRALVIGIGGVVAVAALLFGVSALKAQARSAEVDAPALGEDRSSCSEPDARAAEARAREVEGLGLAKRERYAFDPADGPEALTLLREAAVCFGAAGRTQDSVRADAAAREWDDRLKGDYAALRTRLRLALDRKSSGEALSAVKELELLLSRSGEHPYREWLSAQRRELEKKPPRNNPQGAPA